MYSSVRRLEADGDIEWYWGDESQGGRRKYFRITEKGKRPTPTTKPIGSMQSAYSTHYCKETTTMNEKLNQYLNGVFAPTRA